MAAKKKISEKEEREKRAAEIKKIISEMAPRLGMPEMEAKAARKKSAGALEKISERTSTREYREFKEEIRKAAVMNIYEKMAKFFGRLMKISPSGESRVKIEEAIAFTGLKVTPEDVVAFTIFSIVLLFLAVFPLLFIPEIPAIFTLLALIMPLIIGLLIYNYPANRANLLRIRTGRDLVIAVLYMITYMKTSPNLEGAVRFAATNVGGKLGDDFKEILWKVEVGIHSTVDAALGEYILTWRAYNKEFIEAVHLMRQSMLEISSERRDNLLDKAIDVVLLGTDDRMKKYARDLELPITILHGIGIMLPVMGMIVFPLLSIFLSAQIGQLALYLFVGYDIILPLGVYFFMIRILSKRPGTYTTVDVSEHPDYLPGNVITLKLGKTKTPIPALPIAILIGLVICLPAANFMIGTNLFYSIPKDAQILAMPMSVLFVFGIAMALIFYYWATSVQKTGIRKKVIAVEDEFEEALFALGNRLSGGVPVELALTEAEEDTKELTISELFRITIKNMTQLSMTFKQALFDPDYGALRYFPSRMIKTIMKSLAETVEKGTRAAAETLMTISRYLRDIHTTQERIADLLSSTLSSMRFQAYVLVPTISGIIVAVADLIMRMLAQLTVAFSAITPTEGAGAEGLGGISPVGLVFGDIKAATPPGILQLIVGIYVIEIILILGIFINRIEVGDDKIKESDTIWHLLLFGIVAYVIVLAIVSAMFGGLVEAAAIVTT